MGRAKSQVWATRWGAPALRRSRGIAGRRGRGERKGPHRPPSGCPRLAQKIGLCTIQLAGHQTQGFLKGFPAISREGGGIKDCPASTLISKGRSGPGTSDGWEPMTAAWGFDRCLRGGSGCSETRSLQTWATGPLRPGGADPTALGIRVPDWARKSKGEAPLFFFFSCSAACHSQAQIGCRWGRDPGARAGRSRGDIPLASLAVLASGF